MLFLTTVGMMNSLLMVLAVFWVITSVRLRAPEVGHSWLCGTYSPPGEKLLRVGLFQYRLMPVRLPDDTLYTTVWPAVGECCALLVVARIVARYGEKLRPSG
jgi:hypothetical protein